MEDTLRYYFSAMFQGFAAIITLGAMYILNYFDKIEIQKNDIKEKLKPYVNTAPNEDRDFILFNGEIEYIKQRYLPQRAGLMQFDGVRFLIYRYDSYVEKEKKIRNYLPKLLNKTVFILILSLISLFSIGYYIMLNYFLLIAGIIALIISINILMIIKNIISEVTK